MWASSLRPNLCLASTFPCHTSPGSSRWDQGTTSSMGWNPSRLGARYSSSRAGLHWSCTISFRLVVCVCHVAMICIALWLGARISWPSASDLSMLFDPAIAGDWISECQGVSTRWWACTLHLWGSPRSPAGLAGSRKVSS
jgi:hypothetical protein